MAKDFEIKLDRPSVGRDFYRGVLPNVNRAFERGIKQGLHQAGHNLAKTFRDGVQRQPKTGRVYLINVKGSRRRHRASAPGEYPAIITGDYLKGIDFKVRGSSEMEFGNSDKKATELELGSGNLAPRSALIQSIDARSKDIEVIFSDEMKQALKKLNSKLPGSL